MSVFDKFFGEKNKDTNSARTGWKSLTDLQQLEEIEDLSASRPVVIFKHSTRCSISRMALKNFEHDSGPDFPAEQYYLDLLENREVSNAVADRFGVMHQSPQLLLISGGRCAHDWSHASIDAETTKMKIKELSISGV